MCVCVCVCVCMLDKEFFILFRTNARDNTSKMGALQPITGNFANQTNIHEDMLRTAGYVWSKS